MTNGTDLDINIALHISRYIFECIFDWFQILYYMGSSPTFTYSISNCSEWPPSAWIQHTASCRVSLVISLSCSSAILDAKSPMPFRFMKFVLLWCTRKFRLVDGEANDTAYFEKWFDLRIFTKIIPKYNTMTWPLAPSAGTNSTSVKLDPRPNGSF